MRRRITQAYPMVRVNEPIFVLCLLFPFFCSASSFELSTSSTDAMLRGETLSSKTKKPVYASHINMQTARNNVDETTTIPAHWSESTIKQHLAEMKSAVASNSIMDKSKPVNKRSSPASPLWAKNYRE